MTKKFNIRVYGILMNQNDEVLISDESRHDMKFTKFPGGGLEWGEGIVDCLKREFKEELSVNISVNELFYCTDFFIESAFNSSEQLISLYYNVQLLDENQLIIAKSLKIIDNSKEEFESFRWIEIGEIDESTFTFPIDKIVGNKLKI